MQQELQRSISFESSNHLSEVSPDALSNLTDKYCKQFCVVTT
jgi:hypothetical protein